MDGSGYHTIDAETKELPGALFFLDVLYFLRQAHITSLDAFPPFVPCAIAGTRNGW